MSKYWNPKESRGNQGKFGSNGGHLDWRRTICHDQEQCRIAQKDTGQLWIHWNNQDVDDNPEQPGAGRIVW